MNDAIIRVPELFRECTPIEVCLVRDRRVFVKREDLFGIPPAPPLAKLRGMRVLLQRLYSQGIRLVGCWDTRVSKLGEGLAACCTELSGMRCIVSYPTKQNVPEPDSIKRAKAMGAAVLPVPGGRISLCYYKARKYVEECGGTMLPFGFDCPEAVNGVRLEAARVPRALLTGATLVLCCGSGVTLAGLLLGLPVLPRRIIGISSGRAVRNILACLRRYVEVPACVELHEAIVAYSAIIPFDCPFPTHPNYDLKAWKYLVENLAQIHGKVLFWNIGS